jgi:ribosomal protein S18 acetylase RimI-like enzyme
MNPLRLVKTESFETTPVTMLPILSSDHGEFVEMAMQYFRSLNPQFDPQPDWKQLYFQNILSDLSLFVRWVLADGQRVGFIMFGLERHRILPRVGGVIYELYIRPEFRRKGIAGTAARQAISELRAQCPSKIELQIMTGNHDATAFWKALGFSKVSERYVLAEAKK